MIINWVLFKNLDFKLSADVLGDYTIQGAEIAGADCNYSWPIKEKHWQETQGGCGLCIVSPGGCGSHIGDLLAGFPCTNWILIWLPGDTL
jgi:hypothetical protein